MRLVEALRILAESSVPDGEFCQGVTYGDIREFLREVEQLKVRISNQDALLVNVRANRDDAIRRAKEWEQKFKDLDGYIQGCLV